MKKLLFLTLLLAPMVSAHAARQQESDRRVMVENKSNQNICHIYGSRVSADSWEEDILGDDILRSRQRVRINFNDGTGACRFDLKAVTCDGESVIRRDVNICEISSWVIRN